MTIQAQTLLLTMRRVLFSHKVILASHHRLGDCRRLGSAKPETGVWAAMSLDAANLPASRCFCMLSRCGGATDLSSLVLSIADAVSYSHLCTQQVA